MLKCSIGIMAYNEEQNIEKLLLAIQNQKLSDISIDEIIVVASGCSDRTEEIVRQFQRTDPRIGLISQEKREGKSSAINLWLKKAKNEILVLESADTLPANNSINNLVSPFNDSKIGMTGAHPVPVDNPDSFMGFLNHFMWNLHHLLSLSEPKMGETVAFRKVFEEIPADSSVDEASIEKIIRKKGLHITYVPDAIVSNKGPETISDFLKQRRRIYAGHLDLKSKGYQVSTMSGTKIFLIMLRNKLFEFKKIHLITATIFLEACGRLLGWYDFKISQKNHAVWEIAESTKKL